MPCCNLRVRLVGEAINTTSGTPSLSSSSAGDIGRFKYLADHPWPDGHARPTASTLIALDGAITSNMAIVPANAGEIDVYPNKLTQLILDLSAYFAL